MLVYLFDGTLEGLFTCVFECYVNKEVPDSIIEERYLQLGFEQRIRTIVTDHASADRVAEGLRLHAGEEVFGRTWTAFLYCEADKAFLLRYIRAAFTYKRAVFNMLAHEDVNPVMKATVYVERETQHLRGFTRFSLMENGVYFSRIRPSNNVLPMLMPHFADRYNDQPFIIYDPVHELAGVYPLSEWYLVGTNEITLPEEAEDEGEWKALWSRFYKTIGIQERKNGRQRRNMCPKRFWGDMVEMRGEV